MSWKTGRAVLAGGIRGHLNETPLVNTLSWFSSSAILASFRCISASLRWRTSWSWDTSLRSWRIIWTPENMQQFITKWQHQAPDPVMMTMITRVIITSFTVQPKPNIQEPKLHLLCINIICLSKAIYSFAYRLQLFPNNELSSEGFQKFTDRQTDRQTDVMKDISQSTRGQLQQ